jgi:hypothetical protein
MNPEVRAIRTLRSKVKCVLLTLYVVTATRPQVVAHPLFGVLLVTQGTSPLGSLFGHTPFFEYQQDKSCLNSTNESVEKAVESGVVSGIVAALLFAAQTLL